MEVSTKRLINEEKHINDNAVAGVAICPKRDENDQPKYSEWECIIDGPADSPYAGATINCELLFPKNYPNAAPTIVFNPPIYHPGVMQSGDTTGHMCFEMLSPENYKPSIRVADIMKELMEYIKNPKKYSGVEPAINEEIKSNYDLFLKKCKEWTDAHQ